MYFMCICNTGRYTHVIQHNHALNQIQQHLPKHPYCSNNLAHGICIRTKKNALSFQYLQINTPYYQHYFILDLDYHAVMSDLFYDLVGIPLPNVVIENPMNGKAHVLFQLETPVYTTDASREKPILYARAILKRLQHVFHADIGYSGLLTKNPFSQAWRTSTLRQLPYTLHELANILELSCKEVKQPITGEDAIGLGRNCYLFHTIRHWAYQEVRRFRGQNFQKWFNTVFSYCQKLNQGFPQPLGSNEIKAISKSIARFCWKNDPYCFQEFIDRQRRRSKYGASKGGYARSMYYQADRDRAKKLYAEGKNKTQIAKILLVSRTSIVHWLK